MRVQLLGGTYQAKSLIASAQSCINLYPENNPESVEAPVQVTHYLTPGLDLFGSAPTAGQVRCTYCTSQGELYVVVDNTVYYVDASGGFTTLGTISSRNNPVVMADNGLAAIIVDGTGTGHAINLATRAFGVITDPNFLGGVSIAYVDTYFAINRPATNQWFLSLSEVSYDMLAAPLGSILSGTIIAAGSGYQDNTYFNVPLTGGTGTGAQARVKITGGVIVSVTITTPGVNYIIGDQLSAATANLGGSGTGFTYGVDTIGGNAFDPLDIAAKVGYADPLAFIVAVRRNLWLIGTKTSEIWYNSGNVDFPFEAQPGAFIQHGCVAPYSVASQDFSIYWLSQDIQGQCIVIEGKNYDATRISTHAIEAEFSTYQNVADATGCIYQQEGHTFYVLSFPSENKTWVYDAASSLWHQRAWTDDNGELNRHRINCCANAYGNIIVGDWENGNLYSFNQQTYTDNGQPITRIRALPHLLDNDKNRRVLYKSLIADMQVGADGDTTPLDPPVVSLRYSDTRGASWGERIEQSLGAGGQYYTSIQYQRLGMARDRVFELSWSAPCQTALQGVWIDVEKSLT